MKVKVSLEYKTNSFLICTKSGETVELTGTDLPFLCAAPGIQKQQKAFKEEN